MGEEKKDDQTAQNRVADILEKLAQGESVQLGEFGDQATSTDADAEGAVLYELVYGLREGGLQTVGS